MDERDEGDQGCAICLDAFEDRLEAPCGHGFCRTCIVAVCRSNPPSNQTPCPICRRTVLQCDLLRDGKPAFPPPAALAVQSQEVTVMGCMWHDQLLELHSTEPTIIRYDFMLQGPGGKAIGAFSLNRQEWDVGECDALTWFVVDEGDTFWKHPGMDLGSQRVHSPRGVSPAQWHSMEVRISQREASYSVDGRLFATLLNRTSRGGAFYPERGYLGLVSTARPWTYRNLEIVPAWQVFTHRDCRRWRVRWLNGRSCIIRLRLGRFSVWGQQYFLQDTEPVSFTWSDGTVQQLESFDGREIKWETDHREYKTIVWEQLEDDGIGQEVYRDEQHTEATRRLMVALLEEEQSGVPQHCSLCSLM